jgi:hypothetical protein
MRRGEAVTNAFGLSNGQDSFLSYYLCFIGIQNIDFLATWENIAKQPKRMAICPNRS